MLDFKPLSLNNINIFKKHSITLTEERSRCTKFVTHQCDRELEHLRSLNIKLQNSISRNIKDIAQLEENKVTSYVNLDLITRYLSSVIKAELVKEATRKNAKKIEKLEDAETRLLAELKTVRGAMATVV